LAAVKKRKNTDHDFSTKAGVIAAICSECDRFGLHLPSQKAYIIATAQHETARTFRPLEEYGKGKGRPYGRADSVTGKAYYGRGFVQLTWKSNYQKYSQILNIDLVNKPELASNPNVALFVLVHGFKTGAFTGRRLEQYITQGKTDFINARRCINGMDRASQIAAIAQQYLKQL
jgi:predicted chitinase